MMKESTPVAIRRQDYQPPRYLIDAIDLQIELDAQRTRVSATSQVRRAPGVDAGAPLVLDGQDLTLESIALDGQPLAPDAFTLTPTQLVIERVPAKFSLSIVGSLCPIANKALEGLYVSSGHFCTQCEAEGFRRITWFLDRPDVMAVYRTRIIADKRLSVLLSNGNLRDAGDLPDGRHFALWEDPFPKPCYLFALVAGDLARVEDRFVTRSGRTVGLHVYVEHDQVDQTDHCLQSLKRAMRWDEETFGREYDLDVYMIVAVRDFNMGAMENKGLNLFNAKYVLARPELATDADFQNIEAVVAHEYFHNWSGNRVTCRDWFQLSLKEGFTVFRDQEFSADVGSRPLQRIQDVQRLLSVQFPEDAGPTAHPVRPDSYVEINNFYTPTVYEKGAEVVRMIQTLLGPELFRKGADLYFERHDGQAVTCDDFLRAFADASGRDLSQFALWYAQGGTPIVSAEGSYDPEARRYTLCLSQRLAPLPGQPQPEPMHIPVRVGLLGPDGQDLPLRLEGEPAAGAGTRLLELRTPQARFTFEDVPARPTPSLLRGFSAPVRLSQPFCEEDLLRRMSNDQDAFGRWEAAQRLAEQQIVAVMGRLASGEQPQLDERFRDAFGQALDSDADPALLAAALTLPTETVLFDRLDSVDPVLVHRARNWVEQALGQAHDERLLQRYHALSDDGPYRIDPAAIGRRSLRNLCLRYLTASEGYTDGRLCFEQYRAASNMTDTLAALSCLVHVEGSARVHALTSFYERYRNEALVIDKWFSVQASSWRATTLEEIRALMRHPAFDLQNPNRARALIDSFAMNNPPRFHDASGAGYAYLRECVSVIDRFNSQVAARLVVPLTRFGKLEPRRRDLMIAELKRLDGQAELSVDVSEQVGRALRAAKGAGDGD